MDFRKTIKNKTMKKIYLTVMLLISVASLFGQRFSSDYIMDTLRVNYLDKNTHSRVQSLGEFSVTGNSTDNGQDGVFLNWFGPQRFGIFPPEYREPAILNTGNSSGKMFISGGGQSKGTGILLQSDSGMSPPWRKKNSIRFYVGANVSTTIDSLEDAPPFVGYIDSTSWVLSNSLPDPTGYKLYVDGNTFIDGELGIGTSSQSGYGITTTGFSEFGKGETYSFIFNSSNGSIIVDGVTLFRLLGSSGSSRTANIFQGSDISTSKIYAGGQVMQRYQNIGTTIGADSPAAAMLDLRGNMKITEELNFVGNTTLNRPTGTEGDLFYNTDDSELQVYNGTEWESISPQNVLAATVEYDTGVYTTDASGDITIAHNLGSGAFTATVSAVGLIPYIVQVRSKTTTDFIVRLFDTSGSAVPSTGLVLDWVIRKL